MHYRNAHRAWKTYCEAAGVEADIHALRHSYATTLVNNGVRLEVVRKLLGHKSMQTTLRYAEVNDATVKAELRDHMRTKRF
jgi:site-specific recombinase XerD